MSVLTNEKINNNSSLGQSLKTTVTKPTELKLSFNIYGTADPKLQPNAKDLQEDSLSTHSFAKLDDTTLTVSPYSIGIKTF